MPALPLVIEKVFPSADHFRDELGQTESEQFKPSQEIEKPYHGSPAIFLLKLIEIVLRLELTSVSPSAGDVDTTMGHLFWLRATSSVRCVKHDKILALSVGVEAHDAAFRVSPVLFKILLSVAESIVLIILLPQDAEAIETAVSPLPSAFAEVIAHPPMLKFKPTAFQTSAVNSLEVVAPAVIKSLSLLRSEALTSSTVSGPTSDPSGFFNRMSTEFSV